MRQGVERHHDLSCVLTESELRDRSQQLATAVQRLNESKVRHRLERRLMKQLEKRQADAVAELGVVVRTREEHRSVPCRLYYDDHRLRAFWMRLDTGEIVEERDMSSKERQISLPDVDDTKPVPKREQKRVEKSIDAFLAAEREKMLARDLPPNELAKRFEGLPGFWPTDADLAEMEPLSRVAIRGWLELEDDERPDPPAVLKPWQVATRLSEALQGCGVDVEPSMVFEWTEEQQEEARDWASAMMSPEKDKPAPPAWLEGGDG